MVDYLRRHIGLGKSSGKMARPKWQRVLLVIGILVVAILLLYSVVPPLALFMLFLCINVLLEQHKLLTSRSPIDIEILSTGTAFLSANYGVLWGLLLALIGPLVSHASIDYFGDATIMKLLGHLATALAASLLGTSSWMLFAAVIVGMVVQFLAFVFILGRSAVTNLLARLTTLGFSAYVLFLVLPFLH